MKLDIKLTFFLAVLLFAIPLTGCSKSDTSSMDATAYRQAVLGHPRSAAEEKVAEAIQARTAAQDAAALAATRAKTASIPPNSAPKTN